MRTSDNSNGYFVSICSSLGSIDMFGTPRLLLLVWCSNENLSFSTTLVHILSLEGTPFSPLIMSKL